MSRHTNVDVVSSAELGPPWADLSIGRAWRAERCARRTQIGSPGVSSGEFNVYKYIIQYVHM